MIGEALNTLSSCREGLERGLRGEPQYEPQTTAWAMT